MKTRNRWLKVPHWWFKTIQFINLKEVDLKLLLLLWSNTTDGRVPAEPGEAAFLAGYGQKQKTARIQQALNTLHEEGFLQRDVEGYFFAEWREIMRTKSANFQKFGANFQQRNKKKQGHADTATRARSYSLSENKEDDMKKPLFEGGVFHSHEERGQFEKMQAEVNDSVQQIMKEVRNEK